ncbi:MAG: hypothetical protein A2W93_09235 [Bacteroidetes bacterium GWF2_43_63]|nr:MAG: hypothetical protein A2W94_05615 [Bacteroidetes bacterium GWE2_42_42]OFY54480.1 MAG: hypothetical protein A2W93_09235 [Bacteroidetes bacterium GWF2_43_63]HBG70428.1 hypothetical protein [Bacteroidales bacterium]HCB63455.1 hypothetical protein [Bacteroidales bacterium]
MKNIRLIFLALFLLETTTTDLFAQQTTDATGGIISGSGGSVSYSVGQVFYSSASGTNSNVTEGVQQPYEISEITGMELASTDLICLVFPNPSADFIILQIEDLTRTNLNYKIFDPEGRIIESRAVTDSKTKISMSSFSSGIYFLNLMQGESLIKMFKVVKNK